MSDGKNIVTWCGETTCNICGKERPEYLYDAQIKFGGGRMWATVCQCCFVNGGGALGTGRGQRYKLQGGQYVKIGG